MKLTEPTPPYAPVIMMILPFWELAGLDGRISSYGSRCNVLVNWNGVVYMFVSICSAILINRP